METVLIQDPVARPRLLGPRYFFNTPFNHTGEELLLPSTTQIAVLNSEFSDQQVLLKIASSLIEIFCASMLGENVPCMFRFQSCCGRCCYCTGEGKMFLAQISSISANRLLLFSALGF